MRIRVRANSDEDYLGARHIALHTLQVKKPVQLGRPRPYHQSSFGQRVMEAAS